MPLLSNLSAFFSHSQLYKALAFATRHRRLVSLVSFLAGAYGYFTLPHSVTVARWIAVCLVIGWLALLVEVPLARRLEHLSYTWLSRQIMRYGMQTLHQASFFFCLPILFTTTNWATPQAIFTAIVVLAALASMIDPLYFGRISRHPWLFFTYHAFSVYVAALTLPPLLWQMTTTQSLILASVAIAFLSLPGIAGLPGKSSWRRWLGLVCLALCLGLSSWLLRFYIPPSNLSVNHAVISQTLNTDKKQPGPAISRITATQLKNGGLYAFTAIRAPLGLAETIRHQWRHDGQLIDSIALTITGGREAGYRAWSHKQHFPADSKGSWTVRVITEAGQLIDEMHFYVAAPTMSKMKRLPTK